MDPNTQLSCLSNHFDIILAINHKLQAIPIQWFCRHVKVHQYDHLGHLDRWDTLNVTCDMEAKHQWETDKQNRLSKHQNRFLRGEMWRIFTDSPTDPVSGKILLHMGGVFTNMRDLMGEAIFGPPVIARWHKIGTLKKENHHLVDWKRLKGASASAKN